MVQNSNVATVELKCCYCRQGYILRQVPGLLRLMGDGYNYKVTISSCRGGRVQFERHYHIITRGGEGPLSKATVLSFRGYRPKPQTIITDPRGGRPVFHNSHSTHFVAPTSFGGRAFLNDA